MTLDLEGIHICHILNHCIIIHFQPKNDMNILVKMIALEGFCMVKADSQAVFLDPEKGIIKRQPHLLFSRPYINRKLLGRDA